jgi:hypothetical protein
VKRTTKSLLEELNSIASKKHAEDVVESRALHVLNSAINLLQLIRENYTPEESDELEKRFLSSIKNSDTNKFTRGIRKIRESKKSSRLD